MNPFVYFWLFLKASLFSTGGYGNLPSLHADLIARHWATEPQFTASLLIGNMSPGPNGLWVVSLGYLTNGVPGAMMATIAVTLPPFVVLAVDRLYRRVRSHPAVEGFVRGMTLAVSGFFIIVAAQMLHNMGAPTVTTSIAVGGFALALTRRVPIGAIIALGAVAGVLLVK